MYAATTLSTLCDVPLIASPVGFGSSSCRVHVAAIPSRWSMTIRGAALTAPRTRSLSPIGASMAERTGISCFLQTTDGNSCRGQTTAPWRTMRFAFGGGRVSRQRLVVSTSLKRRCSAASRLTTIRTLKGAYYARLLPAARSSCTWTVLTEIVRTQERLSSQSTKAWATVVEMGQYRRCGSSTPQPTTSGARTRRPPSTCSPPPPAEPPCCSDRSSPLVTLLTLDVPLIP